MPAHKTVTFPENGKPFIFRLFSTALSWKCFHSNYYWIKIQYSLIFYQSFQIFYTLPWHCAQNCLFTAQKNAVILVKGSSNLCICSEKLKCLRRQRWCNMLLVTVLRRADNFLTCTTTANSIKIKYTSFEALNVLYHEHCLVKVMWFILIPELNGCLVQLSWYNNFCDLIWLPLSTELRQTAASQHQTYNQTCTEKTHKHKTNTSKYIHAYAHKQKEVKIEKCLKWTALQVPD